MENVKYNRESSSFLVSRTTSAQTFTEKPTWLNIVFWKKATQIIILYWE